MEQFFVDYLERLESLHAAIGRALEDLPAEAYDWVPGPNMNSLAVLLAHVAGSQRYWVGDIAGKDPSHRVRATEFETLNTAPETLRQRLAAAQAHSREVVAKLTLAGLAEERPKTMMGETCTAGWALLHALEHTAIHAGHIELTRQRWDQQAAGS